MSEMDAVCQNWIRKAPPNRVAIFPREGFHCGMVRRNERVWLEETEPASFVLTWFLEGRGTFITPRERIPIESGCILLRRPGCHWQLQLEKSAETHRYYLQLPMYIYALLQEMQPSIVSLPAVFSIPYRSSLHHRFISLTDRMLQMQGSQLYSEIPNMLDLVREATQQPDQERQKMDKCRSMLENPRNRQPLEELVSACGLEYGMFRKTFQRMHGESPGQYRIRFRIQSAKQLLAEGFSVGDVAQMLHYPDIYTFSHQFRRVTGLAPKDARDELSDE